MKKNKTTLLLMLTLESRKKKKILQRGAKTEQELIQPGCSSSPSAELLKRILNLL